MPEDLTTTSKEDYWNKDNKTSYGKKKEDTKTNPILSLSSDKVQGVN
jgi:hypothetical protein